MEIKEQYLDMKKAALLALSILLIGLNSSCSDEEKTMVLRTDYIFSSLSSDNGNNIASLGFEGGCYLDSGFEDIKMPDDLIGGDYLVIKYTGSDEIVRTESYPGIMSFAGKIVSYNFVKVSVLGMHVDDGNVDMNRLYSSYDIKDQYVILDKDMKYISKDKYVSNEIYLSDYYIEIDPDDSNQYEPTLKSFTSLFAYNPRPQAN